MVATAPSALPLSPRTAWTWLRRLAVADLVVNVLIVVTGGAVRLTGSGLGCPTWPRCTDGSFRVHGSQGVHGAIEFSNRMLTFGLVVVAVACFVAAWRSGDRRARRLAGGILLGIPAQAVIGGITVLTDLNPWLVALHLLCSMAIIAVCVVLVDQVLGPPPALDDPFPGGTPSLLLASRLRWVLLASGWVVLYLGTVVTGAGPHAGDIDSPRNGLDIAVVAHLHASAVYVLVALTVALLVLGVRGRSPGLIRAAGALGLLEVAQAAVGFTQYALGVPAGLVAVHVLGAALTSAGLTWVVLRARAPTSTRSVVASGSA